MLYPSEMIRGDTMYHLVLLGQQELLAVARFGISYCNATWYEMSRSLVKHTEIGTSWWRG